MKLLAEPPCKRVYCCCLRACNNHAEVNLLGHSLDPCWEGLWLHVKPHTHHVESHHPLVACDVAKQLPPSQGQDLNWRHVATPLLCFHVVERLLEHCCKRNMPPTNIICCLWGQPVNACLLAVCHSTRGCKPGKVASIGFQWVSGLKPALKLYELHRGFRPCWCCRKFCLLVSHCFHVCPTDFLWREMAANASTVYVGIVFQQAFEALKDFKKYVTNVNVSQLDGWTWMTQATTDSWDLTEFDVISHLSPPARQWLTRFHRSSHLSHQLVAGYAWRCYISECKWRSNLQ